MHRTIIRRTTVTGINAKAMTGATLIEVMIALVIMSIGLLGLASLQLTGVSANSNSEKRTQAAIVANDIIERMRANPAGVTAGEYATATSAALNCSTPPATVCDNLSTGAAGCTSTQMADYDAYISRCNASTVLQSGTLAVTCVDNTGAAQSCATTQVRLVTVNWVSQTENGNVTKTLTMIFRPII